VGSAARHMPASVGFCGGGFPGVVWGIGWGSLPLPFRPGFMGSSVLSFFFCGCLVDGGVLTLGGLCF